VPREDQRAWIEVDIAAVRRNAETMARISAARLLPMIKADAYGVGVGPVLRVLEPLDPWGYGVATIAEGEELRALGVRRPVIVFTPVLIAEQRRARAAGLTLALGDPAGIAAWTEAGGPWHLAIDTGMARAGVDWRDVGALRDLIAKSPPEGVFTHFHSADSDPASIETQEMRFREAVTTLPSVPSLVHTDNSAAIVRRGRSELPLVRPGIFLYGAGAFAGMQVSPDPVVSIRARVTDVREMRLGDTVSYGATFATQRPGRVATVAYGHADGYPVASSNLATALLAGAEVPVVGRVTMDMVMLDVTGVPCDRGDVVTFVGRDGTKSIDIDALAIRANVSSYELLVRMRNRIPRVYV
jgi:alanine racemase